MKRTTIFADEVLLQEIKEISQEEKRTVAEVMRDAMQQYIKQKRQRDKRLSFIGIGKSPHTDISERHEELLWQNPTK